MITPKKFSSLPRGTRLRKAVRLLRQWEMQPESPDYMRSILCVLASDKLPPESEKLLSAVLAGLSSPAAEALRWNLNALMHTLQRELGLPAADWDFPPAAGNREQSPEPENARRKTLPCRVYVDGIRSPFNLGSIFRTAECFGVQEILIEPGSASPQHPRAVRSAMGCIERVRWSYEEYEKAARLPGLFALELGGTPLEDFCFPPNGVCVIGSEELGVRQELLEAAKKSSGIVSIPLRGGKASLNVSVAFGILLHTWAKAIERV